MDEDFEESNEQPMNPTLESWLRKFGQPGPSNTVPVNRRLSMFGGTTGTVKRLNFDSPPTTTFRADQQNVPAKQSCLSNNDHQELLSLRVETAKLQSINGKLKKDLAEHELNNDREKRRLNSVIQELDERCKHCREQHEPELADLTQQLKQAHNSFAESERNYDVLKREFDVVRAKAAETDRELMELKDSMSCNLSRSETLAEELERRCTDLDTHNTHLRAELSESRARLELLANEKNRIDVERLKLQQKCNQLETDHKEWLIKHDSSSMIDAHEVHKIRVENQALKQTNNKIKQSIQNSTLLQEKLHAAQSKIERITQTNLKLEHENSELKLSISGAAGTSSITLDKLINDKETLTKQLIDIKSRLSDALAGKVPEVDTVELDSLKAQLTDKQQEIDALKERLNMKGDYDEEQIKVLHMPDNPLEQAHAEYNKQMDTLKQENTALKARVNALEQYRRKSVKLDVEAVGGAVEPSESMLDDLNVTAQVDKQLDGKHWKEKHDELIVRIDQLMAQHEKSKQMNADISRQYREMVTRLTGYHIKLKNSNIYEVVSILETDPTRTERSFMFQQQSGTEIQLLDSPYMPHWMDFMDAYLTTDNSFPAFLAAVTLALFQANKDAQDEEGHELESDMEDEDDDDDDEGESDEGDGRHDLEEGDVDDEDEDEEEDEDTIQAPAGGYVQPFRLAGGQPPHLTGVSNMRADQDAEPDTSGSDIVMLD